MIARVSLEIALRKEFDYVIPPELAGRVDVGSRVQVPFGARKVLGCVTALAEESAHTKLKPIIKIIGAQTLVTPGSFSYSVLNVSAARRTAPLLISITTNWSLLKPISFVFTYRN